jgi:very-short-patch-repair endonuclease
MRPILIDAIRRAGVLTRENALQLVPVHVVDKAVASRAIVSMFPGVYSLPQWRDDVRVQRAAAVRFRPGCALSHLDGLEEWGFLPAPELRPAIRHITGDAKQSPCRAAGLVLHRRRNFVAEPPAVLVRGGLPLVSLEQAIVESWTLLPHLDRRVPAIVAVRKRRTTGARLSRQLTANPGIAASAEMGRVFALVAAGCHSPLELWGHEHVFTDPRLPTSRCQVPIDLTTGRIYLDRYFDEEMVDVELDGAAYHGEPGQRERDLRRDAGLAARGIQAVRFSHPRLHADPGGCVLELLDILAMRRRQLGLPGVA